MTTKNNIAPHGYEEDGTTPKTPFGLNVDGTPRKSNRGARPGQRGNGGSRSAATSSGAKSKTDKQRKEMLIQLGQMFITMPVAGASMAPPVVARIGQKHADALAGDAYIFDQIAPEIADGLIIMSASKPGLLGWLDKVEEKAPALALTFALVKLSKAIAGNHANPNMQMAEAARNAVMMRTAAAQAEMDEAERAYYAQQEAA